MCKDWLDASEWQVLVCKSSSPHARDVEHIFLISNGETDEQGEKVKQSNG